MLNPFLALREVTFARPLYRLHERRRLLRGHTIQPQFQMQNSCHTLLPSAFGFSCRLPSLLGWNSHQMLEPQFCAKHL